MQLVPLVQFAFAVLAVAMLMTALLRFVNPDTRHALVGYVGCYAVTYLLGAALIGISQGQVLSLYLRDELYTPDIPGMAGRYWTLLFAPLVVPMAVALALAGRRKRAAPTKASRLQPGIGVCVAAGAGIVAWSLWRFVQAGLYGSDLLGLFGETSAILDRRIELFTATGTITLGLVYGGLPALSHLAWFQTYHTGRRDWRALASSLSVASAALLAMTFQIGPLAVYLCALWLSITHLRRKWAAPWRVAVIGIVALLAIQGLQVVKFGASSVAESALHLIFRMPAAYPYYLDAFPDSIPFSGIDLPGTLLGYRVDAGNSLAVSRLIYPTGRAGAALAAPLHVEAYAEGGLVYALCSLGFVGLLIAAVGRVRRQSSTGPVWHATYIQGMVALYYCSQVGVSGIIWHSMGVMWWISVLGVVALPGLVLRQRGRRARLNVNPMYGARAGA